MPVTATQNTEVTQETAPACRALLPGVVTVFAMLPQVEALTVAGEEKAAAATGPPAPIARPPGPSGRGRNRGHRSEAASALRLL